MNTTTKNLDPLYTIFEQHLFNFQDPNSDRQSFIEGIVEEYINHIRKVGITVPIEWESHIFEELCFQVNSMLVKKIYGCMTIEEYTSKAPAKKLADQKKTAHNRYRRLEQSRAKK